MGKVLHASGSGYFTECVGVGIGNLGGGVFSLDHFMKMYWRAKEFKFSISGEIYVTWPFPPDPVDGIPGLFPFEYNNIIFPKFNYVEDFEGVNPIVNEEQMVCGIIYYADEYALPGDDSFAQLNGVLATSNDLNDPATLYNFNTSRFELDLRDYVPSAIVYLSFGTESDLGFPFLESQINFGGVEVPGRLYVSLGLDYLSMDASQSSFTASFEVDEFFSFGGTINTSTGEPL